MQNKAMLVEAHNVNLCINCRKEPALPGTSGFDAYCPACQVKRDFAMKTHGENIPRDEYGRFKPWVAYDNGVIVASAYGPGELRDDPVVLSHIRSGRALVRVNLLAAGGGFIGRVPF